MNGCWPVGVKRGEVKPAGLLNAWNARFLTDAWTEWVSVNGVFHRHTGGHWLGVHKFGYPQILLVSPKRPEVLVNNLPLGRQFLQDTRVKRFLLTEKQWLMSRLPNWPHGCAHRPLNVSCTAPLHTQFSHLSGLPPFCHWFWRHPDFSVVPTVIQKPCVGAGWLQGWFTDKNGRLKDSTLALTFGYYSVVNQVYALSRFIFPFVSNASDGPSFTT